MDLSYNSPHPPPTPSVVLAQATEYSNAVATQRFGSTVVRPSVRETPQLVRSRFCLSFCIGVPPGEGGRHPEALHERPQAGLVPAAGLVSGGDVSGQGQADASVAGCEDE